MDRIDLTNKINVEIAFINGYIVDTWNILKIKLSHFWSNITNNLLFSIKTKILRYILKLFGYNRPITLINFFHPGRKDTLNFIDFITTNRNKVVMVNADCKYASCVCCKDRGQVKMYAQISQYDPS